MKVLHVITRLIRGGAQENTLTTAILHRRMGVDSEILCGPTPPGPEGELLGRAAAARVPVRELQSLVRAPDLRADLAATLALTRMFRREHFDVVHTHTSKAGFIGRLAARLAAVPALVHTPHGHVFHSYYGPITTRFFVRLERAAAPWADRLVALTNREREEHLDYAIGDRPAFTVIPSGIEIARFRLRPGMRDAARRALGVGPSDFVIGCVARLVPVKGQETLLAALSHLSHDRDVIQLILVGDGEHRPQLERLVRELGLQARVRFLGQCDDPSLLWPGFDVAAVPSWNEGMGRVLVEAMAAEVPVVASEIGGIPDLVVDGCTGLLVPPRDTRALAAAILSIASNHDLAQRLRTQAAAMVDPAYSEQHMAERLLELYRALLAR